MLGSLISSYPMHFLVYLFRFQDIVIIGSGSIMSVWKDPGFFAVILQQTVLDLWNHEGQVCKFLCLLCLNFSCVWIIKFSSLQSNSIFLGWIEEGRGHLYFYKNLQFFTCTTASILKMLCHVLFALHLCHLPKTISQNDVSLSHCSGPKAQDWGETEDQSLSNSRGKFVPRKKVLELRSRLIKFMEDHIYPMENEFSKLANSTLRWTVHPEEEKLKELAKKEGLWNLWVPVCILVLPQSLVMFSKFLIFMFLYIM